jgi:hypothetical protein
MTDPEYGGPGIRGLVPGPGDQVLLDYRHVPGLAHSHWFRATTVRELPGSLELAGWLIARDDLGEVGISDPFVVLVNRPAELVVRRPVDGPRITAGPDPVPLPGMVAQLIEPTWHRPILPASIEDALAHPEQHEPRRDLPRADLDRQSNSPGGGSTAMTRSSTLGGPHMDQSSALQCAYLRPGVIETGRWS